MRQQQTSKAEELSVFSLQDPNQHGGLESYIRVITQGLCDVGERVNWNGMVPPSANDMRAIWQPRIDRLLPFMTRRRTRFFASQFARWQGIGIDVDAVKASKIVHFVGTGWDLIGFPLARVARRYGKPVTCWPAVHPGSWGDAPLDIDLYRQMDAVFCQSDYELDHLANLGLPRKKMVRCGCTIAENVEGDGERFRQTYDLADKEVVLFIGRKSVGKGYLKLRVAIAKLIQAGRPICLISIGKQSETVHPALPRSIDLDLGVVDEETKRDALAACDVFVLPSREESFGIVYVEAWANGKPVVCGTAPASRELVARHQAGLQSDGSSDDLAQRIGHLLDNPTLRDEMGLRGRQAVCDHYTPEKVVQRHLQVWNQLERRAT